MLFLRKRARKTLEMASSRFVSAMKMGMDFADQYYPALLLQPDLLLKFYFLGSTMILVDYNLINFATDSMGIYRLLMSLNLTAIEIQTTNSLYSWHGGVLVVVSGLVKIRNFSEKRKFVQIIFLMPEGDCYLIFNDIFQFINDDASTYQHQAPIPLGGIFDTQLNSSSPLLGPQDLDFVWGQEMHDFVNSIIRDYDPVGESSLAQQQQQDDYGTEIAGETPVGENVSGSFQSMVNTVHEAPAPAMDECVGEAPKKTYASVLQGSKGQPGPSFSARPSFPSTSEWNYTPQPAAQHSNSTLSFVPQARLDAVESLHGSSPNTSDRNQTPQPAAQHSNSNLASVPQAKVDAVESLHGSFPATSERNQTPQPTAQNSNCTLSLVPQARVDAGESLYGSSLATSERNQTPQPASRHLNSTLSLTPQARVDAVKSLHGSSPDASERNQTPHPAAQHSNSTLSPVPQARVDAVESLHGSFPTTSERNQTRQPAAQNSNSTLSLVPQARVDAGESLYGSSPATTERNQTPQPAAKHSNSTMSLVPQARADAVESLHGSSPVSSERNQTPQPAAQHSNSTLSSVPQARVDAVESLCGSFPATSERNQTPQPASQNSKSTLSLVLQARVDTGESLYGSSPATSERNQTPQSAAQHPNSTLSLVPQARVDAVVHGRSPSISERNQVPHSTSSLVPRAGIDVVELEEGLTVEEDELKSVYLTNLPSTVAKKKIRKKFKKFGNIIPKDIVIRSENESCYAVVEFEDLSSVQTALEISPLQFGENEVCITLKNPDESSTYQTGRSARGIDPMVVTGGSFDPLRWVNGDD